jgi:hypothetical protein
MQKLPELLASVLVAGVLAGCASVPMTQPADDTAAKQFAPPAEGRAALYLYREGGTVGGGVPFGATIGQRTLGQLGPATFFLVELEAGTYDVRCVGSDNSDAALVSLAPNETRFLELSVRLSVGMPRCSLGEVAADQGRGAIVKGQRAQAVR